MKEYYTIGAHFKGSSKSYTYKVPNDVKLEKHEACIVSTSTGLSIVRVSEVHKEPQDTMQGINYQYIAYKLIPVKELVAKHIEAVKRL